jgi:hypothetical protein
MFDEVSEGTAIFKAVSLCRDAPEPGYWLTLNADGVTLPVDWYLRIARQIGRMFRCEIAPTPVLPLSIPGEPAGSPRNAELEGSLNVALMPILIPKTLTVGNALRLRLSTDDSREDSR